MGFGLLLVGYTFAFVATVGLGPYLFAGTLIGGFLMYLGISELKKYSPAFIYALVLNVILLILAIFDTAVWVDSQLLLGLNLSGEVLTSTVSYVGFAADLLFNIAMLYGIADLSRRVDYPETRTKAYRNMIFVALFNVIQLLMLLPVGIFDSDKSFFMTLLMILQVLYSILNAFLIFKCYAMICPAGQEDMPRKKSRFEFVNKFHDRIDEKEEKAIESAKQYYEDKLKVKNEKRNNKKRKK